MNLFGDLALRSSIVLLAGLFVDVALARRSAALRHFVLASAIVSAATIVPLSIWLPAWHIPLARRAPVGAHVSTPVTAVHISDRETATVRVGADLTFDTVVAATWAAGCVLSGVLLLGGIWKLTRTSRRAEHVRDIRWTSACRGIAESYGERRPIVLLRTDTTDLLATWGVLRPRVLLPSHARDWSDDRIHVVLCHELAHIRRNDWIVQVGAEFVRTIFWFNPLAWIICTRLRRESEQACDDAVLGQHVSARNYAGHLLDLAKQCRRTSTWTSATPMARTSTLERRIAAMLNPALNRTPLTPRAAITAIALLLVVTLPIAVMRAAQTTPATLALTVYDATGGVMPGVQLTLEDAQGQAQQAMTSAAGRYDFPQIAPGKYLLAATLPGFRALKQEFELRNSRDWDRVITLQVGEVHESITVQERRVTGPVGPSQPQLPKPIRVGGNIRVPTKEVDVHPIYPTTMRDAGREGVVPIEAIIGTDGSVASVRVLTAQVHPDFAIAAVDAVRQWKFTPTLLNGAPVEVVMNVTVQFRLSD